MLIAIRILNSSYSVMFRLFLFYLYLFCIFIVFLFYFYLGLMPKSKNLLQGPTSKPMLPNSFSQPHLQTCTPPGPRLADQPRTACMQVGSPVHVVIRQLCASHEGRPIPVFSPSELSSSSSEDHLRATYLLVPATQTAASSQARPPHANHRISSSLHSLLS